MTKILSVISRIESYALIAFVTFSMGASTAMAAGNAFKDVDSNSTYKVAIEYLSSLDIVNGNPDGTYKPNDTLNRAEMLKILVEANTQNKPEVPQTKCFNDVPITEWYAPYVCYGKEQGWVVGYDNGKIFKPRQAVKAVEALKMTLEAFGIDYEEYSDIWYKGIVNTASSNNYIPFDISGFTEELRRDQMADLITRIIKKKDDKLSEYLGERENIVVSYDSLNAGLNLAKKAKTSVPINETEIETETDLKVEEESISIIEENLKVQDQSVVTTNSEDMKAFNENQETVINTVKVQVDKYKIEKDDADEFITTIKDTMSNYPSSNLIQSSGQDLIDEAINLKSVLKKLIDTGNELIEVANAQLDTGVVPPQQESLVNEFVDYLDDRATAYEKIDSRTSTFVMNEKTVLEEEMDTKQDELERKQKAMEIKDTLIALIGEIDSQLAVLSVQMSDKQSEIDAVYDSPISMAQIEKKAAPLIEEYNVLVAQWNALLEERQKIVDVSYVIDDYYNDGTTPSSADQAYLGTLGIDF